jgi:hypothetical protein
MINWRNPICLSIVVIITIVDGLVHGQNTSASLQGTVRDPSGATQTGEAGTYAVFGPPPSIRDHNSDAVLRNTTPNGC